MRVLITGGNGRLGKWVGRDLRDHGHEVVSVDRSLPSTHEPGIHFRQVEMNDLGQVIGAAAGCDALIHLAAIPAPSVPPNDWLSDAIADLQHAAARRAMESS
jgi:nucleoside-diphosphate-sugar epimerase